MKVSILVPFIGRTELLKNSLRTLTTQTHDDVEVILIDDGSPTDEIELLAKKLGLIYNRLRGPGAEPRIPNKAWLHGYDICRGDFIVLTYAEILVPQNAVERMLVKHEELAREGDSHFPETKYDFKNLGARLIPIQYCLSPKIQEKLDYWFDPENIDAFQKIPGFWKYINHWGWSNIIAPEWRHHCAFTGAPRCFWDAIGLVVDTDEWGADIENGVTKLQFEHGRRPAAVEFGVYHQFHPWERPGEPPLTWQQQTLKPVVVIPKKKTRKEQARPTPGPTIIKEELRPEEPQMSVRIRRIKGLI